MDRNIGGERCNVAADLKMTWREARDDNHFSDEEMDVLEAKINYLYFTAELENLAKKGRVQLDKIPDSAPNKPLRAAMEEMLAIFHEFQQERAVLFERWAQEEAASSFRAQEAA